MKIRYNSLLEYPHVIYIQEPTGYIAYELATQKKWHIDGRKISHYTAIEVESIQDFIDHVLGEK